MNWWVVIGIVLVTLIAGKMIANKYPKVTWEEIVNYEKPKKKITKVTSRPSDSRDYYGSAGATGAAGAVGVQVEYGITEMLQKAQAVRNQLDLQYSSQKHYLDSQLQNQIATLKKLPPPPYYKFHVGDAVTHIPSGLKTFIKNRFGEEEDRTTGTIAFNPHYDLENGMITIPEGDLL